MKKFITHALAVAALAALGPTSALAASGNAPEIVAGAPDRHVVVKGDTLWDIAGRFLEKPWRWPEIWQLNREQIQNPHLIYPGDIVYLDRSSEPPKLRVGKPVGGAGRPAQEGIAPNADGQGPIERLSPRVRIETEPEPVPTIDAKAIEPFLNRPLIVDAAGLATHPRIIATQDGRVYLGRGDVAYVRGLPDNPVRDWHVYRSAKPLLDPDTREPIAWEARYVGDMRLERDGDPATFRVLSVAEEIGPGDRLMPAEHTPVPNHVPKPPSATIAARVVSVYRGLSQVGRNGVVAISAGAREGLSPGDVLAIDARPRVVRDRVAGEDVRLPAEPIGHLLVFRIFDHISYGLIMRSSRDVSVGDEVKNP